MSKVTKVIRQLVFTIPGVPQQKRSTSISVVGKRAFQRPNPKNKTYGMEIITRALEQWGNSPPHEGPVGLYVWAVFPVPKSWARWRRKAMLGKHHITMPDQDRLGNLIQDALQGIIWANDSQVAQFGCVKVYGDRPRTEVQILIFREVPTRKREWLSAIANGEIDGDNDGVD